MWVGRGLFVRRVSVVAEDDEDNEWDGLVVVRLK